MHALVIEGGGMRASYANGVLAALEAADYRPFDAVYGTSAGGALGAWWSARQARFALGTWRYAEDPRIINYGRWILQRGPLLDHDLLFRLVYEEEMPLDVGAVMRAPHPVRVSVCDVDTGDTLYPDIRPGPVLPWLRATGRLPVGTGPPVEIGGRRYLDGGITDPIPLARALEDGATEVLLLLNRPPGDRKPEPRAVTDFVARRYPRFADAIRNHHALHNRAIRLAERPPEGVTVRTIRPSRDTGVRRLTRRHVEIRRSIEAGLADGQAFLERMGLRGSARLRLA